VGGKSRMKIFFIITSTSNMEDIKLPIMHRRVTKITRTSN